MLNILGDTRAEGDETVIITASAPGWSSGTLTITIVDDDGDPYPNTPSRMSPRVGDAEALIRWRAGGNGACRTTEYYVRIYDLTNRVVFEESTFIPRKLTEHSWYVDELTPGVSYLAEVNSYGETCDESSERALHVHFTTNAANSGGDPSAPAGNAKKAPFRVRELSVSGSGDSATATWTRPRANASSGNRCNLSNPREYGYLLENRTTGAIVEGDVSNNGRNVSADLTGLTSGNRYALYVSSYSSECDDYSKYRMFAWTQ